LDSRSFTVQIFCSRSGTGVRNNSVTVNGSSAQIVDVLGNTTVVLTFTGIVPVSGEITINTTYSAAGSDGTIQTYLNAVILTSE
jgi:hypothetical protein